MGQETWAVAPSDGFLGHRPRIAMNSLLWTSPGGGWGEPEVGVGVQEGVSWVLMDAT